MHKMRQKSQVLPKSGLKYGFSSLTGAKPAFSVALIMFVSAPKGRSMSMLLRMVLSTFFAISALSARAQTSVPINVQGRVTTNGLVFNGIGKFKFALVLANGRFVLWTKMA
jgi:hypothetical protein